MPDSSSRATAGSAAIQSGLPSCGEHVSGVTDCAPTTVADAICDATKRLRAADVESPARDARLLMAHTLGLDHPSLLDRHQSLSASDASCFADSLARREAREPVSRIKGRREFWGMEFTLSPDTLDPRPDTETVVEAALAAFAGREPPPRILDLGTGSGCILCALLRKWPQSFGVGVDRSALAAATARRNARALGLAERAAFLGGDWASAVSGRFDLIVSNPPYIASAAVAALAPEVAAFDPLLALDGGADGLAGYRSLAPELLRLLHPGGMAVLEIGTGQAKGVGALLAAAGVDLVGARTDLSGIERALIARRKPG